MTDYCPNCGEPVQPGDAFCVECGTALDDGGFDTTRDDRRGGADRQDDSEWGESGRGSRRDRGRNIGGQGPEPGRGPDSGAGGSTVPRKGAVETFVQGIRWMIAVPVLLGAFVVYDLLDTVGLSINPLFSPVAFLVGLILWGTAYKYVERFLAGEQVEGSVGEVLDTASSVLGRLLSLVGILIVYVIVVGIGFVLFVLPGIYLGARLSLSFPACVLDRQRAFESLSTSWDVAHGNVLKLVGIFLINAFAAIGVAIFGALLGGPDTIENPLFLALFAPLFALLNGAAQMAFGRVYLENRDAQPA